MTSAIFLRLRLLALAPRAADRDCVDPNRRQSHAHRHRLAVLAAYANARVEFEVVTHHRDTSEHVGAVADERRALDRTSHLAVLDQVGLGSREHELAVGDVDLAAAEVDREESVTDR